ncbi:MAG: pseudouridine synthase [Synechococcaceae cyanobacterium ELA182]
MTSEGWLPRALNGGWTYRDRIESRSGGMAVSAFYAGRYRHSGPEQWQWRLAAGEIERNGRPLPADEPLVAGDRLAWHRPPWWEEAVPARWAVVHDDGDLLVLDKPSGLPVLPAGGWLEHTVLRLLERRHQGDPAGLPRPVHRLGRFTSGLLVCARRPATRAWLSRQLRESTGGGGTADPGAVEAGPGAGEQTCSAAAQGCRKLYRALLVPGPLPLAVGESLVITTPIGRRDHPQLGQIWCAAAGSRAGDLAALSTLTLLERQAEADLVQVAIASGRPHQIRIHCAAIGAPLLGDPLYRPGGLAAADARPGEGGYRLQAWRLELECPGGERLVLEAPWGDLCTGGTFDL